MKTNRKKTNNENLQIIKILMPLLVLTLVGFGIYLAIKYSDGEKEIENSREYESYREACKAKDFEAARDTLNKYHEEYTSVLSKIDDYGFGTNDRKKAEGKYYEAFDYIYKAEVQYLLSELNAENCVDKITFLLEEIPIEGEKFPEGECSHTIATRGDYGGEGIPFDAYIVWSQHFNRLCNNILTLAINRKNQDLAKHILLQFVDNIQVTMEGSSISSKGNIKYLRTDADAAKKKYDEAVNNGIFD